MTQEVKTNFKTWFEVWYKTEENPEWMLSLMTDNHEDALKDYENLEDWAEDAEFKTMTETITKKKSRDG